jgi:hypothetical protein
VKGLIRSNEVTGLSDEVQINYRIRNFATMNIYIKALRAPFLAGSMVPVVTVWSAKRGLEFLNLIRESKDDRALHTP